MYWSAEPWILTMTMKSKLCTNSRLFCLDTLSSIRVHLEILVWGGIGHGTFTYHKIAKKKWVWQMLIWEKHFSGKGVMIFS